MKKKVMFFAAALMLVSGAFAQLGTSRQMTAKELHKMQLSNTKSAKVTGNPIWGDTMSYCGDELFYSGVGMGNTTSTMYWAIKIEAAALVGRNTIEAVEFYVPEGDNGIGTYTMSICEGAPTATPRLTQSVTTTAADTLSWYTITLATPLTITQDSDLYICFQNTGIPYPAASINGNSYDNGKWASLDGTTWDLVSNLGVDCTWMIRAISDTHIELPPVLSIEGPATVRMNDTVVFTAVSPNADSYTWNVTADYTYESGNTITAMWATAGSVTVAVDATNTAGTSSATYSVNVIDCSQTIDDFPFVENFEAPIPCWTMISNDPANDDEFGLTSEEAYQGVSSFGFSSYDRADDYNQYLITPEIELPAAGEYMVSFMYNAYSTGDAFRVMASSTTTDSAAFTTLMDMPTVAITDTWAEARVQLPAGTKYVCINYYGDYAYFLWIDDLTISTLSEPDLAISGTTSVGTGMTATFHAASTMVNTFSWSVDGAAQSESGADLNYVFTTVGTHTVTVSATNSIGTTTDSMTVEVFSCDGTTLPYVADFSEGLHCWSNRSDAEEGMGWFASVDMFESDPVGQVLSMSAESILGMFMMDVNIDNWLISPVIAMPAESSYDLTWKVMAYTSSYPTDHYAAYVIAEDGTETMIYEETLGPQNTSFSQRVASLPAGISGNFQVAFRHWDCQGGYVLILDDIQIVNAGTVTGIDNADAANVAIYPNPANQMLNVQAEGLQKVEMLDMSGRTVMTTSESRINLDGIASGIYMIRVITGNGIHTEKVIVK